MTVILWGLPTLRCSSSKTTHITPEFFCDLAHDKGFKVLVAMNGSEALSLAREFHPAAVSLDVFLPDMLGWTVLNHLKQDPATRHIPVQMLTLDGTGSTGCLAGLSHS